MAGTIALMIFIALIAMAIEDEWMLKHIDEFEETDENEEL